MKLLIMPPMMPVSIDMGSLASCVSLVAWSLRAAAPMSAGSSIRSMVASQLNCG